MNMTKSEAIELLTNATYSDEWQGSEPLTRALHMAIDALRSDLYSVILKTGQLYNGQTLVIMLVENVEYETANAIYSALEGKLTNGMEIIMTDNAGAWKI